MATTQVQKDDPQHPPTAAREKVRFESGDTYCAAWHYPGNNGACVVMVGGFAVTKEPASDLFAKRFNDAGFSVLAFDYRHLGESGGHPRQVVRMREQYADWDAAIAFARTLPGVDRTSVAIWAFSAAGGQLLRVAARNAEVAAAIIQAPAVDMPAGSRGALRYTTKLAALRLTGRGLLDALGGLVGREPKLVPLVGPPGSVAMLSMPDAMDGNRALNPGNRYPDWQQAVAARSVLRLGFYRPVRYAPRVKCPLLVVVFDQDNAAPPEPAIHAAERAPQGELVRLPGGHYEAFLGGHEKVAEAELSFLRRHLLDR
jgi:pimeloyl-ACP methyl ester carboxylesterase